MKCSNVYLFRKKLYIIIVQFCTVPPKKERLAVSYTFSFTAQSRASAVTIIIEPRVWNILSLINIANSMWLLCGCITNKENVIQWLARLGGNDSPSYLCMFILILCIICLQKYRYPCGLIPIKPLIILFY